MPTRANMEERKRRGLSHSEMVVVRRKEEVLRVVERVGMM